jgi:hypothetical protein
MPRLTYARRDKRADRAGSGRPDAIRNSQTYKSDAVTFAIFYFARHCLLCTPDVAEQKRARQLGCRICHDRPGRLSDNRRGTREREGCDSLVVRSG